MNWTSVCFDWNHARAFLVTAEEGSLSAAAKALELTQPTLSRQVAALEAEIGVTLFERVGQRLVLTESGHELLHHARLMGDTAQKFSLAAMGQSQQLEGKVVVSVGELDSVFRLPKIIANIRQLEPGIEIEVVVTNTPSDLQRREADIAIRSFRPKQADLIVKKLGEETIGLYGSHEYLKQFPASASLSDLKNIQIIGFNRTTEVAELLNDRGWQLEQKNFHIVTTFQMMHLSLCKEGLGLIFFPQDMGDREPLLSRAFESNGPLMTLPVWLVCHQELRTSLRVRRVFDIISDQLSEYLVVASK